MGNWKAARSQTLPSRNLVPESATRTMAKGDVRVVGNAAVSSVFKYAVEDRTTSTTVAVIQPGEPVHAAGTGNNFVQPIIDGEPVQAQSTRLVGIGASVSTETSSADGYMDVQHVIPMVTVLECRANTPGNVDTQAEFDAIQNDAVTFDAAALNASRDTTPYTIDENEGDDPNDHGLVIIGWDIDRPAMIQVVVKPLVTLFGNNL